MRLFLAFVVSLAACCAPATASDFYTSIYGGLNVDSIIDVKGVKSDEGMIVGGTVGKRLAVIPGLRIEADLSYRTNDIEIDGCVIDGIHVDTIARHDTTALMGNMAFDFGPGPVKFYGLVGGGYMHTDMTFENIPLLRVETSGLAYQAGAGVNVEVVDGVHVGVGYRWFHGAPLTVGGTELSNGENQSAIASLSFDL